MISLVIFIFSLTCVSGYRLCNAANYRYSGQSVTVPIEAIVMGTNDNPAIPLSISGKVRILDGCTVNI